MDTITSSSIRNSRESTFHHPRTSGSTTAATNFGCCRKAMMTNNIGVATLTYSMTDRTTSKNFRMDRDVESNSLDRLTPTLESSFPGQFAWTQTPLISLFVRL